MKKIILALIILISQSSNAQIQGPTKVAVGGTIKLTDVNFNGVTGTWSSANTAVATVTTKGVVTGLGFVVAVKIRFLKSGVNDSTTIYVSHSDSSGYYFSDGGIQLRDVDGRTNLAYWYAISSAGNHVSYSQGNYILGFSGMNGLSGGSYQLSIPSSKIKYFGASAPKSTPDSVLVQIGGYGW